MKNIWRIFSGDMKRLVESFCAGDRDRSLYHTFVVCVV